MTDYEQTIRQLEKRIEILEKKLESLVANNNLELTKNTEDNICIAKFDFSEEECRHNSGWKVCNAEEIESDSSLSFSTIQVERILGTFCDPMLVNSNINLPLDDIKQVHVRLKSNVDASQKCMLRVYFTTEKYPEWSQSKSVHNYYPAGRMFDVYVDTKNRYWNGNLSKLRIDPVEGLRGSIEMELIELISSSGEVVYSVDFTKVADLQSTGWNLKNTSLVSCKGRLLFDVDMIEKKRVYTDPFIVTDRIDVEASRVKYIHIKLRSDIQNPEDPDVYMQILFKTKSSNFWTQDKSMRFSYAHGKDIDAYIEIKQLFWKGRIIALRIDPFETYEGRADIQLIEFLSEIPAESNVDMLEAKKRHLEDRFNKIYN